MEAISARTPDAVDWLKPRPELLRVAGDAMRIDIGSAVFCGDAVNDVIAAKRAGCKAIGLAKDRQRWSELKDAGADAVAALHEPLAV